MIPRRPDPLLEVQGLTAAYGRSQVLYGVDLEVGAGEMTSLLGRNGMGKTTTVYSIMGLVPPLGGSVRMAGRELSGQPPWRIGQGGNRPRAGGAPGSSRTSRPMRT